MLTDKDSMKWADHVGLRFRSIGKLYECVEYNPDKGFLMRLLDEKDSLRGRLKGDDAWVSHRAIGRTYHREYDF